MGSERSVMLSADDAGKTLGALVRELMAPLPWSAARRLCRRGKVRVNGERCFDPAARPAVGARVEVAPEAEVVTRAALPTSALLYVDDDLVVVNKPAGLLTVPASAEERDSLLERARSLLRKHERRRGRGPTELYPVQRLDRDSSGVLVFPRTRQATQALRAQLRARAAERRYVALAHGTVETFRAQSHLVEDRGDGLRGSWGHFRRALGPPPPQARQARTDVRALEVLGPATLIECRLHSGRQHQIRIHLSEHGHPLLGEQVYIRDYHQPRLAAPRLMLHAALLAFEHPRRGEKLRFRCDPPADFLGALAQLRPDGGKGSSRRGPRRRGEA